MIRLACNRWKVFDVSNQVLPQPVCRMVSFKLEDPCRQGLPHTISQYPTPPHRPPPRPGPAQGLSLCGQPQPMSRPPSHHSTLVAAGIGPTTTTGEPAANPIAGASSERPNSLSPPVKETRGPPHPWPPFQRRLRNSPHPAAVPTSSQGNPNILDECPDPVQRGRHHQTAAAARDGGRTSNAKSAED